MASDNELQQPLYVVGEKPVDSVYFEAWKQPAKAIDLARMERPELFQDETAEFFRWNDIDGQARERPLDKNELVAYMRDVLRMPEAEALQDVEKNALALQGDRDLWEAMQKAGPDEQVEVQRFSLQFLQNGESVRDVLDMSKTEAAQEFGEHWNRVEQRLAQESIDLERTFRGSLTQDHVFEVDNPTIRIHRQHAQNLIENGLAGEMDHVGYVVSVTGEDGETKRMVFDVDREASELEIMSAAKHMLQTRFLDTDQEQEEDIELARENAARRLRANNEAVRTEGMSQEEPEKAGEDAQEKYLQALASLEQEQDPDKEHRIPDEIRRRFLHIENNFYFPDEKPAFTDMKNRLRVHEEHHEVINAIVDIAQARGWDTLTVKGSEEFRKAVWLRAKSIDIEVQGYRPKDVDFAQLNKLQESRDATKRIETARHNEIEKSRPREAKHETGIKELDEGAKALKQFAGVLLEHGQANYNFDPKQGKNYFVKLRLDDGEEKTIWGVDLDRALTESSAQLLEKITLSYMGSQPVSVKVKERDEQGKVIGEHEETKKRNTWNVERAEAFMHQSRAEAVARFPDLAPAYATAAAAEKFAETRMANKSPDERDRFVEEVTRKLGDRIRDGHDIPSPQLRQQLREREMSAPALGKQERDHRDYGLERA